MLNIIFVGRLIYAKGIQDLIEAYKDLRARAYDIHLSIVGDGAYAKELETMGQGYGVGFAGELDHAGVMAMLRMSDIFVNPSYSEGLPTSVMEAASVGLPIIASDVGGTNEIITDDESGLLYKAGDVSQLTRMLRYLLDNPDRRKTFGERAKATVAEKFDWDKITDQYESLLKEVVR
jgi:glycosyltransferase involved in cell wall biosynthesis